MSALPQPWKSLSERVYKIEEALRRLQNASPFSGTGLSIPDVGTTQVTGNLWVTGDFTANGKINNDALVSPVVPGQAFQGASTFTLTVAGAGIITINRTVPTGFTSVVVSAYGRLAAVNSTASSDALYCSVDVNGTGGNQFGQVVAAGSFGSLSAGYGTLLTGLTAGDNVATRLYGSTGLAGWASNAANGADLSVTYLWFR